MKPKELYKRKPERVDNAIYQLYGVYHNHVPEIEYFDNGGYLEYDETKRIEIHYFKDHMFDSRRYWALVGVKFDGEWVMIIQNAGREGDDYVARFITNYDQYKLMVEHIKTLIQVEYDESEDVVDIDVDIESLDKFYGYKLDGYFDKY